MSHEQLHRDIAADIKRDGRSVLCIPGDDDGPSFAYTIGNALVKLPELLIIGTTKGDLLNDLSQIMLDRGRGFDDGELVDLGGRFPAKIIVADDGRAQSDYTIQAGVHFGGDDYVVQQVLAPDRNGRFPDEPGCCKPYSTVPILRRRNPH